MFATSNPTGARSVPRPRKPEHRRLPERWIYQHRAFYFRVPPGLEEKWDGKPMYRLGATLPEAYKRWAERLEELDKARIIGQLLDRYALEVIPTKAPKTQAGNTDALRKLRAVFGQMPLTPFAPRLVYQYVDRRGSKVAAHREIGVISHAFPNAADEGYIAGHPF